MAIYHCSIKPVQRSKGRSSVAAAAYRSGEKLEDNRTGLIHDFSRKSGVDYTEIIGFEGSRSELWNAAESAERRKDATTAREYEIAIPSELSQFEKKVLVSSYGQWLNQRHGVAVDIAIHDIEGNNPHAHILTTTRQSDGDQLGDKVAREWSDTKRKKEGLPGRKADLEESRKQWEILSNKALEQAGHDQRIDHRSLADQGIERVPQIHLGPNVIQMEKRGKTTDIGQKQSEIKARNEELNHISSEIIDLKDTIHKLKNKIKKQEENIEKKPGKSILKEPKIEGEAALSQWKGICDKEYNKINDWFETEKERIENANQLNTDRLWALRKIEPRRPDGMLAVFKQSGYEKEREAWQLEMDKNRQECRDLRSSMDACEERFSELKGNVESSLQQKYPDLAKEAFKEREKQEKERAEIIRIQLEKRRQRSRSRSRGMGR